MKSAELLNRRSAPPLGIAAVSSYRPPWQLPTDWFENISRKFVKHTGIQSRPISREDEVTLALRATKQLVKDTFCDLQKCAGVVFTSPSFVPMSLAWKHLDKQQARREQLSRAAHEYVRRSGLQPRCVQATNTFCAGYARALEMVLYKIQPQVNLRDDEFVLVVTSSRISRITDYACPVSGALFGDLATVTMISRTDSRRHPVHFELLDARVERQQTNRPFFRFAVRQQVLTPAIDGSKDMQSQRFVFSLDGMGIADVAPRAMAAACSEMARDSGMEPGDIQFIIPHQAGFGIVRLTEMKLRDAGFTGKVINGMTEDIGNVSSGSIPYTLQMLWDELHGNLLCPVASVGRPGKNAIADGCIAMRATPVHEQRFETARQEVPVTAPADQFVG
jgi:3-oxoacyl-[acyl-carrier-protein] synthase III